MIISLNLLQISDVHFQETLNNSCLLNIFRQQILLNMISFRFYTAIKKTYVQYIHKIEISYPIIVKEVLCTYR